MRLVLLIGLLNLLSLRLAYSQCLVADFNLPADACIEESFFLKNNNSTNGGSFDWDFCVGDFNTAPTISDLVTVSSSSSPRGVKLVFDGDNWWGFVLSRLNNKIIRLDFGSSLSSIPTIKDLGNVGNLLSVPDGIDFYKEGENWYGLLVNNNNSILLISFGSRLSNDVPFVEKILINASLLNQPRVINIVKDGTKILALIGNFASNQITRLDFGSSIVNPSPLSSNFSVAGVSGLMGISIMKDCENFFGIVSSYNNSSVFKLSFGKTIFNSPTVNLLNNSILNPGNLRLVKDGAEYFSLVPTNSGALHKLSFGRNLENNSPVHQNLGNFSVLSGSFGFDIAKENSSYYCFPISTSSNKIHKIKFSSECSAEVVNHVSDSPVIKFSKAGEYFINLTAYNSFGDYSSVTKKISIRNSTAPTPIFTVTNNCILSEIKFNPQNLTPDQTITSHTWTFPDGSIQTTPEASYRFSKPGTYKVRLNVESDNSCGNFIEKEITVYPEPQAAYNISANLVCTNAAVTFTNQTDFPEESVISYSWDFKDGTFSTEKSPKHTFAKSGTYLVELSASIPGCTSSVTQTVNVEAGPQTLFAASPVCDESTVVFENQTTGENIKGYRWDLGDETFAQVESPVHVYDAPGTYLVRLESENTLGCVTSHTQTIRVYSNPVPDFSVSPACAGNEIYFTDATTDVDGNIIAWSWEFEQEDGSVVKKEEQNPSIKYSKAGTYQVALTTTTTWNCKRMIRKTVVVDPVPVVDIALEGGCLGAPSILTDATKLIGVPVQSWYWRIGDRVFTDKSVNYTFPAEGTYEIFLQLNLENGCSVSGTRELVVSPLPAVDFDYSGACQGQTAHFEATVAASEYIWNVEGKIIVGEGRKLEHMFRQEGTYQVSLTVANEKGCLNTLSKKVVVGQPPVAAFTADRFKGVPPFKVQFENGSSGAVSYRWFFKDGGQSSSTEANPAFTFTEIGDYAVEMVAFNEAGCSDTVTQLISVVDPNYDVVLNDVHLIRQDGQIKVVLALENKGTIRVTDMNVEVQINNEYTLTEKFNSTLEIGQSENYSMNMQLLESGGRRISFVCIKLKPVLTLVQQELSVLNNEKCLSFDQVFVMQEPYPNPGTDNVTFKFVLPAAGTILLDVYSSQGTLVESLQLENRPVGFSQQELQVSSWGKGIYFVRARYGREEKRYRFMKN